MSETLIVNATLLPVDPAMATIEPGWIHVSGATIAGLGGGTPPAIAGAEVIDATGDLFMPGMVNTHAHLAMTLFRGLGEDVEDRLFRYILPLERKFVTPEMVRIGTRLAALELIQGGVTAVADMYYFEAEIGRVLAAAGLRGVVGQTLADFSPPDHRDFEAGFALVEALHDEFRDHPLITPSIAPHAPYSTDLAIMARAGEWAAAHPETRIQMHLAEMDSEVEWCAKHYALSPVMVARKAGILVDGLIAAHCLHLDESDIAAMAEAGVRVAHNARSNGKGGRGIAPVEAMRRAGIAVGLASDGPMSGNTLDLFAQFAPASMFQKLLGKSRKPMPAREVIRMATIEGARVLGLERQIGSLEPGKQADIIRISLAAPRLQPIYDIPSALVFAATPDDVRDVMVAGRWLMRGRETLTLEPRAILRDAGQVASRFKAEMVEIDRKARG